MNNKLIDQWLYEHGITQEPSFVSTLKKYAWAFKKRPASAFLMCIAALDVQNTI